jgi:uncharacterized membrane protein YdbT with pleckstrin-like domain
MNHMNNIDSRFGVMLMEGEEVLLEIIPTSNFATYPAVICCLTVVGMLVAPFAYLLARYASRQYRYWLTNRRVILSNGFIGHRVRSIPLERVSDVALSRTLPEMLAGVTSLYVRDMTGETSEGTLIAVGNAPEVQRRILEEVQRVNSTNQTI